MSESKPTTTPVNVRLNPSDSSAHPRAVNYTNVVWRKASPISTSALSSRR